MEQHFTYRLMLELDQVVLLNSSLIGQLIQLHKRIREHDGILRLCGLSSQNRSVLHTCALDDRFRSYDSRVEAIMGRPTRGDPSKRERPLGLRERRSRLHCQQTSSSLAISSTPAMCRIASWAICF